MIILKKILAILINFLFLSVVFGLINNKIKWSIHDSKIKRGSLIIEYFDVKEDILAGALTTTMIYIIYALLCKLAFKNMSTIRESLVVAFVSYSILYLFIALTVLHDPKLLWISIIPVFIIGFLLPFSEQLISKTLNKVWKDK